MIAITPWRRTLATWVHPADDLYTINPDYLDGVERAGSHGVLVGHVATVDEAKRVLGRCDGLILSGGNDVDPSMYGASNTASIAPDRRADISDIACLHAARSLGLPVLAICRGAQILNVAFGGTLHQEVWGRPQHPARDEGGEAAVTADRFLANRHSVTLAPGSRIEALFGCEQIDTNSLHHQAADQIGTALVVTGSASDGTVEVIEHETEPLIGVQWHPERMLDEGHQVLFDWLVAP